MNYYRKECYCRTRWRKTVRKHNTTITATTIVEYEKKITIPKTTQEAFLMENAFSRCLRERHIHIWLPLNLWDWDAMQRNAMQCCRWYDWPVRSAEIERKEASDRQHHGFGWQSKRSWLMRVYDSKKTQSSVKRFRETEPFSKGDDWFFKCKSK